MNKKLLVSGWLVSNILFSFLWAQSGIKEFLTRFDQIPSQPTKTYTFTDLPTLPSGGHLQGIQYYAKDDQESFYLSGSSDSLAYLLTLTISPSPYQKTFTKLALTPMKHAGGIQIKDHYLIVGIEDNKARDTSVVNIYTLDQLNTPVASILRRGPFERATAGAVALEKWDEHHWVMVANWDARNIDVYRSNGKPLNDVNCSFELLKSWSKADADYSLWEKPQFLSYQNINLFEVNDTLFLMGFARNKDQHFADVFLVNLEEDTPANHLLHHINRKVFFPKMTNFSAGAGMYMDEKSIRIFSCDHHQGIIEVFE